jgi:hypothetical protein
MPPFGEPQIARKKFSWIPRVGTMCNGAVFQGSSGEPKRRKLKDKVSAPATAAPTVSAKSRLAGGHRAGPLPSPIVLAAKPIMSRKGTAVSFEMPARIMRVLNLRFDLCVQLITNPRMARVASISPKEACAYQGRGPATNTTRNVAAILVDKRRRANQLHNSTPRNARRLR